MGGSALGASPPIQAAAQSQFRSLTLPTPFHEAVLPLLPRDKSRYLDHPKESAAQRLALEMDSPKRAIFSEDSFHFEALALRLAHFCPRLFFSKAVRKRTFILQPMAEPEKVHPSESSQELGHVLQQTGQTVTYVQV